jgi:hypothetical protein
MMNYSYTQISQYLTCPRRYRHRYLDGWQEKDTFVPPCFSAAASNRPWRPFSVTGRPGGSAVRAVGAV